MEDDKQKQTEVKNFYGGIYFDRCQMTDIKFQTIVQGDMHVEAEEDKERDAALATPQEEYDMPPQLQTQEAEALLKKLTAAGIVDECWDRWGCRARRRACWPPCWPTGCTCPHPGRPSGGCGI